MTKKERIAKLEKELEELKLKVSILEATRLIGVGDVPNPLIEKSIPTYPWTPTIPYPYPIITWSDTTNDTANIRFDG